MCLALFGGCVNIAVDFFRGKKYNQYTEMNGKVFVCIDQKTGYQSISAGGGAGADDGEPGAGLQLCQSPSAQLLSLSLSSRWISF